MEAGAGSLRGGAIQTLGAPLGRRTGARISDVGRAISKGEYVMKLKLAVAALALVVATPAFAAEYFIVQNAASKKCTVAAKKPTTDKVTLVGDGTAYKSKKEAQTAMKAADACHAKAKA
jgi:hypothetical protein